MKYLILLLLITTPTPASAMLRIDQSEQPTETFRRIKRKIDRKKWINRATWAAWIGLLAWFTATLGWTFLVLFGTGCLVLVGIAEITALINTKSKAWEP